jgi:hypothetical protein
MKNIYFREWLISEENSVKSRSSFGSLHGAVAELAKEVNDAKSKEELDGVVKKYGISNDSSNVDTNNLYNFIAQDSEDNRDAEHAPDNRYISNAIIAGRIAEKEYPEKDSSTIATHFINREREKTQPRTQDQKLHVQIYNHNSELLPKIIDFIVGNTDQVAQFKFAFPGPSGKVGSKGHRRDRLVIYLTDLGVKERKVQAYLRSIDAPYDLGMDASGGGGSMTEIYSSKLWKLIKDKLNVFRVAKGEEPRPARSSDAAKRLPWHIPHLANMGPEGTAPESFMGNEKHLGTIRAEMYGSNLYLTGSKVSFDFRLNPDQIDKINKSGWKQEGYLESDNSNLFGSYDTNRKQLHGGSFNFGIVDVVLHGNKLKMASMPTFRNSIEITLTTPQMHDILHHVALAKGVIGV